MGRFKSKLPTLRHTYRLCRLGGMPEPVWLDPYIKVEQAKARSAAEGKKIFDVATDTRRIEFPEDRLIRSFYDRYPSARYIPVDLRSFDPPLPRKFAMRQLAYMEAGMSQKAAREKVEAEMTSNGELKFPPRPSIIKQIQLEEDRYLMEHFAKVRLEKTSGSREIPK